MHQCFLSHCTRSTKEALNEDWRVSHGMLLLIFQDIDELGEILLASSYWKKWGQRGMTKILMDRANPCEPLEK